MKEMLDILFPAFLALFVAILFMLGIVFMLNYIQNANDRNHFDICIQSEISKQDCFNKVYGGGK